MNQEVKQWMNNKTLFKSELEKGHRWELFVAEKLKDLGYVVEVPELGEYKIPNDPSYSGSHDMTVNGSIVEVKSRNLEFTGKNDFPYPTIFVKSKCTYDKMEDKPTMCVCVSQKTGACVALDVEKTHSHWKPVRFWDRVRKIHTTAYECDKELWEPLEEVTRRVISADGPCDRPFLQAIVLPKRVSAAT